MKTAGLKYFLLSNVGNWITDNRVLRLLQAKPEYYTPDKWEKEYSTGRWDYLWTINEQAHYHLIGAYFAALKRDGTVLDVGCGEGILEQLLRTIGYRHYVGVDISQHAIAKAAAATDDDGKAIFHATDAECFVPDARFDTIIFNETIYYFRDPALTLERFASWLEPDGVFILSIAYCGFQDSLWKLSVWRQVEAGNIVVAEMCVHGPAGPVWVVKALKPRRESAIPARAQRPRLGLMRRPMRAARSLPRRIVRALPSGRRNAKEE